MLTAKPHLLFIHIEGYQMLFNHIKVVRKMYKNSDFGIATA